MASVEVIILKSGWQFRKTNDVKWFPAKVPGTVHTDLLSNRIINDPFYGTNEKDLQWIDTCDWEYQNVFDVDEKLFDLAHLELDLEGIDTYAEIRLNDSLVFSADNMFRTWKVDCKKLLKKKNNLLSIRFESAVRKGKQLAGKLPYTLPGEEKVFTRKAAYHYGWDWGPRFVTCGIWRVIKIIGWNNLRIVSIHISQNELNDSLAKLTAHFEIETDRNGSLHFFANDIQEQKSQAENTRNVLKGIQVIDIPFTISQPKRWWTNGLGEAHLYHYLFAVKGDPGFDDHVEQEIGLRTIELIQEKDSTGTGFYFKLNGIPVFMKGANYIPADHFLPRITKDRYESIVRSAKEANMNMLRVWGGGVYEDDQFYRQCDQNGILVWQDFMFACSMYPGDPAFVENVKQEIIDNVKRLRNHACIALWCGNNEIDEGWHNWGWQQSYHLSENDSTKIWNDYQHLFHQLIPELLDSLIPVSNILHKRSDLYWPSSPSIGWGRKESLLQGDSHYWGVWWGMEPFEVYKNKIGRFMSEYGFQGMPSFHAFKKFCDEKDLNLKSAAVKNHQKHPTGFETIQTYLEKEYRRPKDFQNYIYVSQLLQAEGIKTAIEAHRIAKPFCMGTLYWQLNDSWPVVSWSSMDYEGEWKALHYAVQKAYQDILIVSKIENGKLKIHVVNDRMTDVFVNVSLKLFNLNGTNEWNENIRVLIKKNSSQEILGVDTSVLLKGIERKKCVFDIELNSRGKIVATNNFYFAPARELQLSKPKYSIQMKEIAGGNIQAEICTEVLVKNVYIQVQGKSIEFNDNYFDMLPGKKYLISPKKGALKKEDEKNMVIKSLIDSYE